MDPILTKIKRLIIQRKYIFTEKADTERIADGLSEEDVLESILNATFVRVKNSRSAWRTNRREKTYILESFTYDGLLICSKGIIRGQGDRQAF